MVVLVDTFVKIVVSLSAYRMLHHLELSVAITETIFPMDDFILIVYLHSQSSNSYTDHLRQIRAISSYPCSGLVLLSGDRFRLIAQPTQSFSGE